jgi:hypothetical protein
MADEFLLGARRLCYVDGNVPKIDASLKRNGEIILAPQLAGHVDDFLGWSIPRKLRHDFLLRLIAAV